MFDLLANHFSAIFSRFKGDRSFDQKTIDESIQGIKDSLLEADVPYDLVVNFTQDLKQELEGQKVIPSLKPKEQFIKIVYDKLVAFLGGADQAEMAFLIPSTIMVMGLQGSGKTTTIAKIANYLKCEALKKNKNRKILLASVDFYRPAAIDQLEVLAKQIGVDFYRSQNTDSLRAAQEIEKYAKDQGYEYLFLDTAGRLHIDSTMLSELQAIDSSLEPKHKILVLDAMTGQESLNVARAFEQAVGFQGAILTKTDSDSRGGAAFSFRYALKKPIVFIGTGEKPEDLDRFHIKRVAGRMLGMGDLDTLLEKAQEKIKEEEQRHMQSSLEKGNFTLQDFAQQIAMINRLGSFGNIMKYIPGMAGMSLPEGAMEQGEKEIRMFRAIISSMTMKERIYPRLLNDSRMQRIARGAGVEVNQVKKLLSRFEQMQQYVTLIKKSGGIQNIFKGR